MTGYIQQEIIRIGKDRGQIEIADLKELYAKNIQLEMKKLVIKGHFEKPIDDGVKVIWKFIK